MKITSALASLFGVAVLSAAPAAAAQPVPSAHRQVRAVVHEIRQATSRFDQVATAESAGYVPFQDVNGVSCIDEPGMGGMGVHYVNPTLIGDPTIDPSAPEAIVYAPDRHGKLHLAALEYLVDKAAWNTTHRNGPHLLPGHPFDVTTAPNRYGLDTFYSQHVWVWKHNPAGLSAMWNPTVHCPRATM